MSGCAEIRAAQCARPAQGDPSWTLAENGSERVVSDVATAEHDADGAASVARRCFSVGRDRDTCRALDDHLMLGDHESYRVGDLGFAHEDAVIDQRAAEIERDGTRLHAAGGRVGQRRSLGRRDDLARSHAFVHRDGVLGPATDDLATHCRGDARDETSTADGDEYGVERWALSGELEAEGTLPRDDGGIVIGE